MRQTKLDLIHLTECGLILHYFKIHPLDAVKSVVILKILTMLSLFLVILKYVSMIVLYDLETNNLYRKIDAATTFLSLLSVPYLLWLINECGLLLDDINCHLTKEEQKLITQEIRNILFSTIQ